MKVISNFLRRRVFISRNRYGSVVGCNLRTSAFQLAEVYGIRRACARCQVGNLVTAQAQIAVINRYRVGAEVDTRSITRCRTAADGLNVLQVRVQSIRNLLIRIVAAHGFAFNNHVVACNELRALIDYSCTGSTARCHGTRTCSGRINLPIRSRQIYVDLEDLLACCILTRGNGRVITVFHVDKVRNNVLAVICNI